MDWKAVSVVKSRGCSAREPGFDFQHPHDSSPPQVIPVPGDLKHPSDTAGIRMVHRQTFRSVKDKRNLSMFIDGGKGRTEREIDSNIKMMT